MTFMLRALREAPAFAQPTIQDQAQGQTPDKSQAPAQAPTRFLVFPAGEVLIEDDVPCRMDEAAAREILAHWRTLSHDMVVDYEHQTLSGERAPAAGWITGLEWRADGLWAQARWTEAAAAHIVAGEYRYHSPVFLVRKGDRRIVRLYNVALTNQPRMRNVPALAALTALAAKEGLELAELPELPDLADLADVAALPEISEPIEPPTSPDGGDAMLLTKLLVLLGLDPTASEEEALAAIEVALQAQKDLESQAIENPNPDQGPAPEANSEVIPTPVPPAPAPAPPAPVVACPGREPVACKAVLDALNLGPQATARQAVAVIAGFKAPARAAEDLGQTVATLQTELLALKRDRLVEQALAEGKTSPAELTAWGRDLAAQRPDQFQTIVLSRPAGSIVPVGSLTIGNPASLGNFSSQSHAEDDELQRSINRQLGLTQ